MIDERYVKAFEEACQYYGLDLKKFDGPTPTVIGQIWRYYDKQSCKSSYIEVQNRTDSNSMEVVFHDTRLIKN